MYLSIFDEVEQSGHVLLTIDAASLYSEFEKVKDERKAKGKRYQLPFLLTVIMLGKMAGEKSIKGRVDWVEEMKSLLKQQLGLAQRVSSELDL